MQQSKSKNRRGGGMLLTVISKNRVLCKVQIAINRSNAVFARMLD